MANIITCPECKCKHSPCKKPICPSCGADEYEQYLLADKSFMDALERARGDVFWDSAVNDVRKQVEGFDITVEKYLVRAVLRYEGSTMFIDRDPKDYEARDWAEIAAVAMFQLLKIKEKEANEN